MLQFIKFIILAWWVAYSVEAVDWCSRELSCHVNGQLFKHTMCLYPERMNSSTCSNVTNLQTDPGRQSIVDTVNAMRLNISKGVNYTNSFVLPPLANMRRMSYDMELEQIALRWALQCPEKEDSCRRSQTFENVGQIFVELSGHPNCLMECWFSRYRYPDGLALNDRFLPLIRPNTHRMGCAHVAIERAGGTGRNSTTKLFICNFAPGGDLDGQGEIIGPPCSACDVKADCLCEGADEESKILVGSVPGNEPLARKGCVGKQWNPGHGLDDGFVCPEGTRKVAKDPTKEEIQGPPCDACECICDEPPTYEGLIPGHETGTTANPLLHKGTDYPFFSEEDWKKMEALELEWFATSELPIPKPKMKPTYRVLQIGKWKHPNVTPLPYRLEQTFKTWVRLVKAPVAPVTLYTFSARASRTNYFCFSVAILPIILAIA